MTVSSERWLLLASRIMMSSMKSRERALGIIDVAAAVGRMDPGGERGILQRRRRTRRRPCAIFSRGDGSEVIRLDDAAAHQRQIGVVVGDPLAHPEPRRRLHPIVAVRAPCRPAAAASRSMRGRSRGR